MQGKKQVLQAFTPYRRLNSDGLYPNFTHDLPASKIADLRFLTDSVVESPGLPGCVATQPTFYQLKTTTTKL